MTELIPIEKPEEPSTLFKVSTDNELDDAYIAWIKLTPGARWIDIQGDQLNIIRENRDGVIYIYNQSSDSWDIDVI